MLTIDPRSPERGMRVSCGREKRSSRPRSGKQKPYGGGLVPEPGSFGRVAESGRSWRPDPLRPAPVLREGPDLEGEGGEDEDDDHDRDVETAPAESQLS